MGTGFSLFLVSGVAPRRELAERLGVDGGGGRARARGAARNPAGAQLSGVVRVDLVVHAGASTRASEALVDVPSGGVEGLGDLAGHLGQGGAERAPVSPGG